MVGTCIRKAAPRDPWETPARIINESMLDSRGTRERQKPALVGCLLHASTGPRASHAFSSPNNPIGRYHHSHFTDEEIEAHYLEQSHTGKSYEARREPQAACFSLLPPPQLPSQVVLSPQGRWVRLPQTSFPQTSLGVGTDLPCLTG